MEKGGAERVSQREYRGSGSASGPATRAMAILSSQEEDKGGSLNAFYILFHIFNLTKCEKGTIIVSRSSTMQRASTKENHHGFTDADSSLTSCWDAVGILWFSRPHSEACTMKNDDLGTVTLFWPTRTPA
jgi:hypothetical protein